MHHLFYIIYGYTYHAILHERIGPVWLLEIPVFLRKKDWDEVYWDREAGIDDCWSEYYLIVPANRYSIVYKHADQDDTGRYYQRLIHFRRGGWVTNKQVAYQLLRETESHPEHFRRIDGKTIFKKATRDFARTA